MESNIESGSSGESLDSLRDQVYTGAIDDTGSEDQEQPDFQETASETSSEDPLGRELSDEEREGYPDYVRTVKDVLSYARELNRYKGNAGNEIGELRKKIEALSQTMATPKQDKAPMTPEEYNRMIENGLATNPVATLQEMQRMQAERLLAERMDPLRKEVETMRESFRENMNRTELDAFVAKNNMEQADLKELFETIQKRMEIYNGSAYFTNQPRRVLEDAYEFVQARRSRSTDQVKEKRASVISKGSGVTPRGEAKTNAPTREDVESMLGFR